MTITHLTLSDQLSLLARQASRMETFGEHDALILRTVAKHVVALQADRDRLAGENATLAIEVCRLNGVIRDLQDDLDMAMHENSRLESPDVHD